MKKTIKYLAFILMLVVAFTCIAMQASAADASALTFAKCEGGLMVSSCKKDASGELTIPEEYQGEKVVKIAPRAFENCTNLTKVVMADSIKAIGESAFEGCIKLEEVTFSYGLETIDTYAFFACDSLKSVTLYPNLKTLGSFAFYDCEALESAVIPEGFVTIPEGAFGDCAKLATISIPMTVEVIDNDAFVGCSSIKTVYYIGSSIAWYGIEWGDGNDKIYEVSYNNFNHIHDFKESIIKEPTCTVDGIKVKTCVCGYTERAVAEALKHSNVKIEEIKATCEETGMTAGEKCTRCGEITTAPQTIPAKGHGTLENLAAVEATCTKEGKTAGKKCTVCNKEVEKQEVIEKLPHNFKNATVVQATLKTNGKIEGFCTSCNEKTETILYSVTDFKLAYTSYTYNGKARKPALTVKDSAGNKLVMGDDYEVTYASGRKNPGTYSVKVVLKGNYSGSKTVSFNILPTKAESIKAQATKKTTVKLTWKEVTGATGYRIYIFNSATGTKKVKLTAATTNSYTLTKDYAGKALKMGTKYKISVTPYTKTSNGKYLFASEATEFTFKFAPSAPTLKVTSTAKGKATLEWSNVAAETGYKVYTSTDGKTFKLYKTYKDWPDKQTISGYKSGKTIYFKVRAYTVLDSKTTVYGSYSPVKSIKIK